MDSTFSWVVGHWWIFAILVLLGGYKLVMRLFGVIIISEDEIGIVNKKFVLFGANKTLPDGKIIALNGEAGIQADTLAPGLHWGYFWWQYEIKRQKFITIPDGNVGVVHSRDGAPLNDGRVLADGVDCDSFQNARKFLGNGGQRGPQISVITPGTYRINTALFNIKIEEALDIPQEQIGLVTTRDGAELPKGEIAGKKVEGHDTFQNAQAFIKAGGFRGPQEQVMLPGRYYVNPIFAKVELSPFTAVKIAHVGVVIAYVGEDGQDVTGSDFMHGNLVEKGKKGVWVEPLDPGKYPINPRTHHVEEVPTANVVLNWANDKTEAHKLDERLSSISVRSLDGFKYPMDVSQIIHIPRADAPKVIARFGSVANLVTQVLEPTIGNYFRNAAQRSDVIGFLAERSKRQEEAKAAIVAALKEYNVVAVDTLIGDIVPPDDLMKTLTDRKLADQEKITYATQKEAQEVRKQLAQAQAQADTQPSVVKAERDVEIAEFNARAAVKKAEGDAKSKTLNAEADAKVTELNGNAEAGKIQAIGDAEASVLDKKGKAIDPRNYAAIQIAASLSKSGFKLVPDVAISSGANGGNSSGSPIMDGLLATMLVRETKSTTPAPAAPAPSAEPEPVAAEGSDKK
ncbi:MAG: SPFH domain-containing protein [Minisyncoccia bacterium]